MTPTTSRELYFALGLALFAAVQWLLKIWLEARIKDGVRAEVDKRLDEEKQGLQFDYQRKLQDFQLFATKRHEINATAYARLRDAYSTINRNVFGLIRQPALDALSDEEIDEYLKGLGASVDERREMLRRHAGNRKALLADVWRSTPIYLFQIAQAKLVEAMDFVYSNELFFSARVAMACDRVIELLRQVLADVSRTGKRQDIHPSMAEVPRALAMVKGLMRADLLGIRDVPEEAAIVREEEPNLPQFFGAPRYISAEDLRKAGVPEDLIARLVHQK